MVYKWLLFRVIRLRNGWTAGLFFVEKSVHINCLTNTVGDTEQQYS